jgi:hypothetical protein
MKYRILEKANESGSNLKRNLFQITIQQGSSCRMMRRHQRAGSA